MSFYTHIHYIYIYIQCFLLQYNLYHPYKTICFGITEVQFHVSASDDKTRWPTMPMIIKRLHRLLIPCHIPKLFFAARTSGSLSMKAGSSSPCCSRAFIFFLCKLSKELRVPGPTSICIIVGMMGECYRIN